MKNSLDWEHAVTSMLIGIIATGIQSKIESLKKGNVPVMEENHILVLGFEPGEYTLIQELVYGADKRPCCIVVVGEADREEMEDAIRSNVKCPKNVRILCRSVNVLDPDELSRCSLDTCRTVLISPADVDRTVQTLLAVIKIFGVFPIQRIFQKQKNQNPQPSGFENLIYSRFPPAFRINSQN